MCTFANGEGQDEIETEKTQFVTHMCHKSSNYANACTSIRSPVPIYIKVCFSEAKIVNEYDQEIPQSQTADKPLAQ